MAVKIEIHPDARKSFDEKANILLQQVISDPNASQNKASSISSEIVFQKVEVAEVTSSGYFTELDGEVAKTIAHNGNVFGLFDEDYRNLVRLSEAFQKRKGVSRFVGVEAIKNEIFSWIASTYKKESTSSMCDAVLPALEEQIKEVEVWLPLHRTVIESDIEIGKCVIKTITKEMIDDWHDLIKPHSVNSKEETEVYLAEERRKFQGFAAATIKLTAESHRASEIAIEEAEKALSVLRLFTASSFHPQISSYCVLLGREHYEGVSEFVVEHDRIVGFSERTLDTHSPFSRFTQSDIQENFQSGMKELGELLAKDEPTPFEEEFLNGIFQYSKGCLTRDISDKLIHILVGIESLLLKDGNEPIQKNIGERMAALIGSTAKDRKAIIDVVTKTYSLRSSFIHHGKRVSIDDMALIQEFMMSVWEVFNRILHVIRANQTITRNDFFALIEEKRLSY